MLTDSCITELKAQGTSRNCDESQEEEGGAGGGVQTEGVFAPINSYSMKVKLIRDDGQMHQVMGLTV